MVAVTVSAIVFLAWTHDQATAPTSMTQGPFEPMSDVGITTTTATNTTSAPNAQHRVAVGGGNLSVSINQFSPSTVQYSARPKRYLLCT